LFLRIKLICAKDKIHQGRSQTTHGMLLYLFNFEIFRILTRPYHFGIFYPKSCSSYHQSHHNMYMSMPRPRWQSRNKFLNFWLMSLPVM